ncbi:hypothetical protein NIZ16_22875 (plasmid) [Escherichia albertii]|uniref:hypothetical protein n=1 Tax=Escherichia albertii TaxID=208962 RepID=UPI002119C90F|nr:hypothetical protein [Escherichia albertii]UUL12279.1 hypothetical protein NIZ16_22875 [Escherichia albertii]
MSWLKELSFVDTTGAKKKSFFLEKSAILPIFLLVLMLLLNCLTFIKPAYVPFRPQLQQ